MITDDKLEFKKSTILTCEKHGVHNAVMGIAFWKEPVIQGVQPVLDVNYMFCMKCYVEFLQVGGVKLMTVVPDDKAKN